MCVTKPSKKIKKKRCENLNLELKAMRIAAGYNGRAQFVAAVNDFLRQMDIDYKIGVAPYNRYESDKTVTVPVKTAYYISKFLCQRLKTNCSLDVFVDKKVCL